MSAPEGCPAGWSRIQDASAGRPTETEMDFDLLLRGGWVLDGTGGPAFRADVALLDTMIGAVGRLDSAGSARVVDVSGHYVVPGFIDAHVHGDLMLLADPIH